MLSQKVGCSPILGRLLALLPGILIQLFSFGLIQLQLRATQKRVDINEAAISQANADFTKLINLISANKNIIAQNNAAIQATNNRVSQSERAIVRNENVNASNRAETARVAAENNSLRQQVTEANNKANNAISRANQLTTDLNTANAKIQELTNRLNNFKPSVTNTTVVEQKISNFYSDN